MKRILLYTTNLIIVWVGMTVAVRAQDPNFTQYFSSPMTVNPALIGKEVADWRAIANYRTQWFGNSEAFPFRTSTISIEKRLSQDKIGTNQLALGMMVLSDESNAGLLKNNYASAGLAYNNALDAEGKMLLGAGIMVNYHNRILDPSKFIFQSQYGSMGYQPNLGTPDGVNITKDSYVDVNVGVHFSERRQKIGYSMGISYFHASKPQDGAYLQNQHYLYPRLSWQGSLQFNLNNRDELEFSSLVNHQVSGGENPDQFMLGAIYKLQVADQEYPITKINFGFWDRFNQSASAYFGVQGKSHWLFGVSYDFIINDQKTGFTNYQSMEFSFGWQFAGNKHKEKLAQTTNVLNY